MYAQYKSGDIILFALKCQMTHLGVITEHVKFELFSSHYKIGTATSALGVL